MTPPGEAPRACVVGWPLAHSLSPQLHGYWLKKYGLRGSYTAFPARPEALAETLAALAQQGYCGINLTLPHKELVLPMLAECDDAARAIGAANTLWLNAQGRWCGSNSDAEGFLRSLQDAGVNVQGKNALVLGAGGAARAVVYALLMAGVRGLTIANRSHEKAQALCDYFNALPLGAQAPCRPVAWEEKDTALAGVNVVVQATSLGMQGQPALEIDLAALSAQAVVVDIIYSPRETPLLAQAKARGLLAVDGLGMLMHQAAPGFSRWFGQQPEVDAGLREHLERQLQERHA